MTMTLTCWFLAVVLCFLPVTCVGSRDQHPCDRPCVEGQTMTCRYNFTLEWFRTLGKGCYACPFNQTDCYREQCVAGDGFVRLVMAINRQVPGPAIQVCEGDSVEVQVVNQLEDGLSTSLHWHGQHVFRQPYFDGAGGITQCNIHTGETFVYKFRTGPAGTHWYHSHTGMQLADGAFGPLVVRQTPEQEVQGALYDLDLSQHVLMVYNWMQDLSMTSYLKLMHVFDASPPQSVMVNGRARHYNVTDPHGLFDTNLTHAQTPLELVEVERGLRYRLRFISASPACPLQVSVDHHTLLLISQDGMPVMPRVVDAFIIHPGERYDLVLSADKTVDNYWLRVIGLGDCEASQATGMAIVRYQGAAETDPPRDPSTQRDGVLLNPILYDGKKPAYGYNRSVVNIDDLRSMSQTNYTEEHVDVKVYIGLDYNTNDNTKYNHKNLYPVDSLHPRMMHSTPVIDNITFTIPPVPLLSQSEDVDDSWFCNRSTLDNPDRCLTEDLCMCVHTLNVPLNKVVEIVLFLEGRFFPELGHLMHLHGHNFRLLGLGKLAPSLSRSEVEEADRRGQLRRNFISPPVRDTVNVPDGGYAIIRFVADNPGYWFFHCHTDSHLQQGMAMLIKVGELSDLPPVPADFPRCGGMGYSNSRRPSDPCPTGAAGAGADSVTAMVTVLLCLCAIMTMF